jgi:hypothetical protein
MAMTLVAPVVGLPLLNPSPVHRPSGPVDVPAATPAMNCWAATASSQNGSPNTPAVARICATSASCSSSPRS